MGHWEDLSEDLLIEIEKILVLYADKVRVRSVCNSWKSPLPEIPSLKEDQLPWLLVPCFDKASEPHYGLFNVRDKKTYHVDLPKTNENMLFRGSNHGWIVSIEGPHDEIYLRNPLTGAKIQLPSRSRFPDVKDYCADNRGDEYTLWFALTNTYYTRDHYTIDARHVILHLTCKFLLSSDPSVTDDFVVVAIYGECDRLAYCRNGDEKRSSLSGNRGIFEDATFYEGKFYAIACDGSLHVIGNIDSQLLLEKIAEPPIAFCNALLYLVESSDGLLLVERNYTVLMTADPKAEFIHKTVTFNVFKLDLSCSKWRRVTDIGDDALFVGSSTSVSRSFFEFPELKKNSIYFTDNLFGSHYEGIKGGTEIGVFDISSESMMALPAYKCDTDLIWPPPIWFIPTLQ